MIDEYEDWWTTDPMSEELTEEVKEKKAKTHFTHSKFANKKSYPSFDNKF